MNKNLILRQIQNSFQSALGSDRFSSPPLSIGISVARKGGQIRTKYNNINTIMICEFGRVQKCMIGVIGMNERIKE